MTHYGAKYAMGTRMEMVTWDCSETAFQTLLSAITAEVNRIEDDLSIFSRTSTVHHLNTKASEKPIAINNELWSLIRECLRFSQKTNGAFDITMGFRDREDPNSSVLKGSVALILGQDRHSIKFVQPGMRLDFGAIGKGYALDRSKQIITSAGVDNVLINFGGSIIYAKGRHPSGHRWSIGINNPDFFDKPTQAEARLDDLFLSTSASVRKDDKTGELTPHILDPRTGYPVPAMRQIAVSSPTGIEAEALSTALVVLSDHERNSIMDEFPGSQIVQIVDSDASLNLAGIS